MGITAKLNRLRSVLGIDEHFTRERKIPLFELVVSLVTSFSVCNKTKAIADIRRNFIKHTGKHISTSSFWDRLASDKLVRFLEKAIYKLIFQLQQKTLSRLLLVADFKEIFIYDASPIRLPSALSDRFAGNRKNHSPACLKLSALYQMSVRSVKWIELTAQKIHDSKVLPELNQLKGSLFLFDLGYFSHDFLHRLNEANIWFICRLKGNSIPTVSKVITGVAKSSVGLPLNQVKKLRGNIVEMWANLNRGAKGDYEVRLIGFRFPETDEYRWYVTNLPSSMLLAKWVYPLYRLRWQIELFFKSIKSTLHADQVTSANKNIALSIVYGSILASLIASYLIIGKASLAAEIELRSITAQRLMKVFALIVDDLAQCMILKSVSNICLLRKMEPLFESLVCPNRKRRPTSFESITTSV